MYLLLSEMHSGVLIQSFLSFMFSCLPALVCTCTFYITPDHSFTFVSRFQFMSPQKPESIYIWHLKKIELFPQTAVVLVTRQRAVSHFIFIL